MVLDAELAAALPPLLTQQERPLHTLGTGGGGSPPASPDTAEARIVRDDLFDGLLTSSDDEDWAADMAREQRLQVRACGRAGGRAWAARFQPRAWFQRWHTTGTRRR